MSPNGSRATGCEPSSRGMSSEHITESRMPMAFLSSASVRHHARQGQQRCVFAFPGTLRPHVGPMPRPPGRCSEVNTARPPYHRRPVCAELSVGRIWHGDPRGLVFNSASKPFIVAKVAYLLAQELSCRKRRKPEFNAALASREKLASRIDGGATPSRTTSANAIRITAQILLHCAGTVEPPTD